MRVKANPLGTSNVLTFYSKCITKCLTLKMKVMVMEFNINNDPIRLQISTYIKVIPEQFTLALTVFKIFTF